MVDSNTHIVTIVLNGTILGFPKPIKDKYVVTLVAIPVDRAVILAQNLNAFFDRYAHVFKAMIEPEIIKDDQH